MVGPAVKREAVAHLQAVMGLSERRACSLVDADRKMIRYKSRRPPDAELRARLRELAKEIEDWANYAEQEEAAVRWGQKRHGVRRKTE